MSLFRQIWLVIIGISLLLLLGFFTVGLIIAADVQKTAQAERNLGASKLLALQWQNDATNDLTQVEQWVRSLASKNEYDQIKLTNAQGKVLYQFQDSGENSATPQWFRAIFSIDTAPAMINLRYENKNIAILSLSKHRSALYDAIWNAVVLLFTWMSGGMVIIGIICNQVLGRMRKPINAVVHQAQAIAERRFELIPVSTLPELKPVTLAMNDMVERLKHMFENEAKRLEAVRREAHYDRLTGLEVREAFIARLNGKTTGDEASHEGALFIVRLFGQAEVNRHVGYAQTDKIIQQVAHHIAQIVPEGGFCGRLNGVDFAVFLPENDLIEKITLQILEYARTLIDPLALGKSVRFIIGATPFAPTDKVASLLSRVDVALAEAEASGWRSLCLIQPNNILASHRNQDDWRKLFQTIGAGREIKLAKYPVRGKDGALLHWESPLRIKADGIDQDPWIIAGAFMAMAIRLGQTARLDLAALTLAMNTIAEQKEPLAINISGGSLGASFTDQVQQILEKNQALTPQLNIDIPEQDVYLHFSEFREFCQRVKRFGVKIGVKKLGHQLDQAGNLHGLGLDYFKVDSSFILHINDNPTNQTFLQGLVAMAHAIGVQVIAQGVHSDKELATLKTLNFDGFTGPSIK